MKSLLLPAAVLTLSLGLMAETNVWLHDLPLEGAQQSFGRPRIGKSIEGHDLKVAGQTYAKGVGVNSSFSLKYDIVGEAKKFEAIVGLDDDAEKEGSVIFRIYSKGKVLAESPALGDKYGTRGPVKLEADLTGAKLVELYVDEIDGDRNDHADWIEARFVLEDGARLVPSDPKVGQLGILSPAISSAPRINGAALFGARPGHEIIWRLPVSGVRPMKLSVRNLPEGLSFDKENGILRGSVAVPGTYPMEFTAQNRRGQKKRTIRLVIGEGLALTPPMGWNSWNCFAGKVTEEDIRKAADLLVSSGLADHGYNYVNIDDFWQNRSCEKSDKTLMGKERNEDGSIAVNSRFKDMKALAEYVHSKGLRIGLYSSPGPYTCGRCTGSYQHEEKDAKTYAGWGFDYLKYDWCSYGEVENGEGLENLKKPYALMGEILRSQDRDILYSLCQYGWGNVSSWGREVGGSCWRTTGDITDTYASMMSIVSNQEDLWPYAGPDAWNDPDMLIVGVLGWGSPHPTKLTHNEQYTHMTMWAMLAAPLLIGCDLAKLDPFTLSLLTNDEVIEVNQDELGAQAAKVFNDEQCEGWVRPLADGSFALAIINHLHYPTRFLKIIDFHKLGLKGHWLVRDLWRQYDVGVLPENFKFEFLGHAPQFLRFYPREGAGLGEGIKDIREKALNYGRMKEILAARSADTATAKSCEGCQKE